MSDLNEKRVWAFRQDDISVEIAHWGVSHMNDGNGVWNYYLTIVDGQLSEDDFAKLWLEPSISDRSSGEKQASHDTYSSIMEAWSWHGGITFYEKCMDPDTGRRWVKIGCDYNHAFDRDWGYGYDIKYVEREARETVSAALASLAFKRRCAWNGKWMAPSDMVERNGRLYSPDGLAASQKWRKENPQ